MVNVTKSNFIEQSNSFLEHLPTADFVAIDEEMTGICLPNTRRPAKDHNPSQRYEILKAVPERYSIIQLGICLFHRNPNKFKNSKEAAAKRTKKRSSEEEDEPEYLVRQYNFYVFPPADNNITREVVLNPSSIAFLNQHSMDFDLWSKQGIPFVTGDVAERLIARYCRKTEAQKQKSAAASNGSSSNNNKNKTNSYPFTRRRVELRRTEDIEFHARAMASLREWLDSANPHATATATTQQQQQPIPEVAAAAAHLQPYAAADHHHHADVIVAADQDNGQHSPNNNNTAATTIIHPPPQPEGVHFLLPPCNSFLRRALYESINAEYPTLILEPAGTSNQTQNQIRVWRLNPQEKQKRQERLLKEGWEDLIRNQIGMWRIFAALSLAARGLPIPTQSIPFAQNVSNVDWDYHQQQIIVVQQENNNNNDNNNNTKHSSASPNNKSYKSSHHHYKKDEDDYDRKLPFTKQHNGNTTTTTTTGRKIPIIVHNGYMDLLFLMTHFHSHQLPDTFAEAKTLIRHYFPIVYDTKVLSTECAPSPLWNDCSHLENLYMKVVRDNEEMSRQLQVVMDAPTNNVAAAAAAAAVVPNNNHHHGNNNYQVVVSATNNSGAAHEAAYDAYMTGAVFVGICRYIMTREQSLFLSDDSKYSPLTTAAKNNNAIATTRNMMIYSSMYHLLSLEGDEQIKYLFGRNMLYLMLTMYTIDLENNDNDPLSRGMLPESTFRVSGFDSSVTTGDIVRCLSGLIDSHRRRVNFEIVWVDDTTFLVAACYKAAATSTTTTTAAVLPPPTSPMNSNNNNNVTEADRVLKEHGRLVKNALKQRFQNRESIIRLDDYLAHVKEQQQQQERIKKKSKAEKKNNSDNDDDYNNNDGWTGRLWSLLGSFWSTRKRQRTEYESSATTINGESPNKRRRL